MKEIRQNTNNTIQALWIGMGSLSSFALSIISAAILSRYFEKSEYGTYKQIIYVYNTFLVVFSVGLPNVFGYFLPRYSLAQGKDIVWKITKVLFVGGFVFSLFLFLFSGTIAIILKNPELKIGLKYFSVIPMLLLPTLGIEGIFSTYKKSVYIAIYNTATRLLMLAFIVVPVIVFKGSYLYAIYGWIVASVVSLIIAYFFKGVPFKGVIIEKSNLSMKMVFAYCLPLVGASIAGVAIKAADQFYISRYFGADVFAEYSNGFIEIPFVGMVTGAVSTVLLPIFSKMVYEKSDNLSFIDIWKNVLNKSAALIYPMVVFFIFYSIEIVTALYSVKYTNSGIYFRIAMLTNFFNIVVFAPLLFAMGKTKFYSSLHIFIAISSWVLGYVMVLIFKSPIAIAILSVLLSILKIMIAFMYVSKLINVRVFKLLPKQILYYILHSVVAILFVRFLLFEVHLHAKPLITISISALCYVVVLLITAIPLKLNYISMIQPLASKIVRKNKLYNKIKGS